MLVTRRPGGRAVSGMLTATMSMGSCVMRLTAGTAIGAAATAFVAAPPAAAATTVRCMPDEYTGTEIDEAIRGYQPGTLRRRNVRRDNVRLGAEEFAAGTGQYEMIGAPEPGVERFTMRLQGEDGSVRDWPLAALAVLPRVYSSEVSDAEPPVTGFNMLRIGRTEAGARPRQRVSVALPREADALSQD